MRTLSYRPHKSAAMALGKARDRCWKLNWVVDVDIKGYFDNIPHDLLMKAVRKHCRVGWMLLYIERWLKAPLQKAEGTITARTKGVPQGSIIGPVLVNLYLHYVMDRWLEREFRGCRFERYADDAIIHCHRLKDALVLKAALERRMKHADCNCIRRKRASYTAKTVTVGRKECRRRHSTF